MKIETFQLGSFLTNCYLLTSDDGREALLVDAPEEIEQVIDLCDSRGLAPKMLINTHGHMDHIAGNQAVKDRWPDIELAIHAADQAKLRSAIRNLSLLMGMNVKSPPADRLLAEGDSVDLGGRSLEVLHTPGHSPGGISLLTRSQGQPPVVFTGDALFAMGIGRTDFPGASLKTLLAAIHDKLLVLPDETVCHPGHGPLTTIGQERTGNPFLKDM
ncbi:MAG: MBL fold metallo-hydrolase [Anaerolineaceae bacterium]|nr:MBL fold metallo-hydrolase [Anaerolineaceae bacterium]